MESVPQEQWRAIPGHEGYEVSDQGRVRSLDRVIERGCRWGGTHRLFVKGKVLAQVNKQGYMAVAIGHPVKPMRTNILVAMAWIGPRQDGIHVNHINGIKSDNRACNLEYATCSENHLHAFRTGLRKAKQGEQCWTAKLDESKVRAARSEVGMSPRQLAEKYGISVGAMRQVLDRKTWKHVTA